MKEKEESEKVGLKLNIQKTKIMASGLITSWETEWCFWTVVLEKTFESPLDCKEIQQSSLKEISTEYSLEGLMLKLQYFGYLMQRANS